MGQTVSSKSYGSTIFGYTTTSIKSSVYIKEQDDDDNDDQDEDNLLFKPFLYGLGINHSTTFSQLSSLTGNSKTDSGFLLYEKNSQLWKDLTYIDQTYYPSTTTTSTTTLLINKEQEQYEKQEAAMVHCTSNAMNFNDISSICLSMHDMSLSKRGFGSISSNIGLLPMIRKLELSYNSLRELPQEIGYLQQLEYLSVSHNQIKFIPDSICHLSRLTEFNVSHNKLQALTPFIRHLSKLQTLNVAHNQLKEITVVSVESINSSLALLDLSYNPIPILPAEITQLPFLRRFRLEGCPLTNSLDQFQLSHNPSSLLEICARLIIKKSIPQPQQQQQKKRKKKQQQQQDNDPTTAIISTLKNRLTESLYQYVSNYKVCSHCHGPYFDSYVSRGRYIDRNDVWIPLEYRLCSAHWSDESDRIYSMFSSTAPSCTLLPSLNLATTTFLPPLLSPSPSTTSLLKPSNNNNNTTPRTHRSCFRNNSSSKHRQNRRPSTATAITTTEETQPVAVVTTEEQEHMSSSVSSSSIAIMAEVVDDESSLQPVDNLSFSSTVKRWKYKVRNNSSLFLKSHGLY